MGSGFHSLIVETVFHSSRHHPYLGERKCKNIFADDKNDSDFRFFSHNLSLESKFDLWSCGCVNFQTFLFPG